MPVKYFLNSYRALSDGKTGVRHLEEYLQSTSFLLSDWKVIWVGACSILRTSIALFQVDTQSCINEELREGIRSEWNSIKEEKDNHKIYWEFLRRERDNILHEYEWSAYEAWMDQEGNTKPAPISLLTIKPDDVSSVLIMRSGLYKGRNSLELLKESADWVEERIYCSIRRARLDPDEERNIVTFKKRPPADDKPSTILGQ